MKLLKWNYQRISMKKFVTKLSAIAATSAALSIAVSINAPKADAAMFNLTGKAQAVILLQVRSASMTHCKDN